jgi:cytochrome b6-f complex iron-sulfur subunit
MAAETQFLLHGNDLDEQLQSEFVVKDSDGSYWLALYQKCVHLGCTVPFKNSCASFKCPCHGSHYNVDGEYLDGPAPRSLDRFQISFQGDNVVVNTGVLNQTVAQPDETTRLIAPPSVQCTA